MTPKHSPRAAKALAYFKRSYNDIDIFVEDTGNHNMWLALLRNILPSTVKLTSVNLLGGKDRVIQACRLDQECNGRKKLYIIDGDYDFILGRKKPRLKHLYRLHAYCVENLLVSEASTLNIGLCYNPKWDEARIANELRFDEVISEIYEKLAPLFLVYASAFNADNRIRTIGNSVTTLIDNCENGVTLCKNKIWRLCIKISRLARLSVGQKKFKEILRSVRKRANTVNRKLWISGKDYIFPIFRIILKKRLSVNCDTEQLKVLLANNWMEHMEPRLARRIRILCA